MSAMIERMARAICKSRGDDWEREGPDGYLHEAMAAIEAMREPTDAMKAAAVHAAMDTKGTVIAAIWSAMIGAASVAS